MYLLVASMYARSISAYLGTYVPKHLGTGSCVTIYICNLGRYLVYQGPFPFSAAIKYQPRPEKLQDLYNLLATGGSTLYLPCSHVAKTAPSLCLVMTPRTVHIVCPAPMSSHAIKIFSPTGIGLR